MNTVQGGKMKLKRPTLATTENCIKLLKEIDADLRHAPNANNVEYLVKMVLAMLTNDERWIEEE